MVKTEFVFLTKFRETTLMLGAMVNLLIQWADRDKIESFLSLSSVCV